MPKYTYKCSECDGFELYQLMTDDPISICPKCNGHSERMISLTTYKKDELKTNIYRREIGAQADQSNSQITYTYECQKCGLFDLKQSIVDEPISNCTTCDQKVERLISNDSIFLPSPRPAHAYKNARKYKTVKSEGEERRAINPESDGYYGAQH